MGLHLRRWAVIPVRTTQQPATCAIPVRQDHRSGGLPRSVMRVPLTVTFTSSTP